MKREVTTVNTGDKKRTGTTCSLKSDFDHERLRGIKLAMSSSVLVVAVAVPDKNQCFPKHGCSSQCHQPPDAQTSPQR